MIEIYVPKHVG